MNTTALLLSSLLALPLAGACASNTARLKSDDEARGLDTRGVGSAELEQITSEALGKLFARHSTNLNVSEPYLVAFAGIDSRGGEELRDHREALLDIIEREINDAGPYEVIARRFVERAMREVDMRDQEDLFLPKNRDAFLDVLGGMADTPRYLIWASFTTQTDRVGETMILKRDIREVTYNLNVSMIDVETGKFDQDDGRVTKEYKSR